MVSQYVTSYSWVAVGPHIPNGAVPLPPSPCLCIRQLPFRRGRTPAVTPSPPSLQCWARGMPGSNEQRGLSSAVPLEGLPPLCVETEVCTASVGNFTTSLLQLLAPSDRYTGLGCECCCCPPQLPQVQLTLGERGRERCRRALGGAWAAQGVWLQPRAVGTPGSRAAAWLRSRTVAPDVWELPGTLWL